MAVRNIRTIRPRVWIPPVYTTNWRMTIERSDGSVDDITDIVTRAEIVDGVTEGIGSFHIEFPNPNETYTGVYTGMEIFRYYSEYSSGTPSTLTFRGRVEKPSYKNSTVILDGRSEARFVVDKDVTKEYIGVDASTIVLDLFSTYGESRFTTTNVAASTSVLITVSWKEKAFNKCMEDLCVATGYDWYIDHSLDVHFFESGTRQNPDDAIVHENNLLDVGDFADDVTFVRNEVRVYGANFEGVQVLYTARDTTSQGTYGVQVLKINDDNITTYEQAVTLGDALLADSINPPKIGEVKGFILATIQPGESIRLSAPYDNLPFNYYVMRSYRHEFDVDVGFSTTITINREPRKFHRAYKERVEAENRQQDTSSNPEGLDYSYTFLFDTDEGTHDDTIITNGVLTLQTGATSGSWVSGIRTTSTNVNRVYVHATGQTLNGVTIEVSANSGVSYQTIPLKTLTNITTATGTGLVVRVTISDTSTQIDGLSILYTIV